ncbi:hypothetical protein DL769_010525 [Monosporascus sp. CRB-8-3]|nr:hypothetical protein DL769_010525 [Monosporascus sp. CRB-8-3]
MALNFLGSVTTLAILAVTFIEPCVVAIPTSAFYARFLNDSIHLRPSYDYVIVGGGTAGLTVADRLTEDGKHNVLVIENGPLVNSPLIDQVRGGLAGMGSGYVYPTISVPQVNLGNRRFPVMAGNLVGGSSAVNAMMTVRGTSEDYDRWGNFFGVGSTWSWEGLLPYFKKALTFTPPDEMVAKSVNIVYDEQFWGKESKVYAGWPSFQYPGLVPQIEAFREMPGVEFPSDSGAGRAGVYWFPTFMDPKNVQRSYARTGHYENFNRSNYDLITESKVKNIVLDEGTATGVVFQQTKLNVTTDFTIRADKEVILAAGAIHSPQILQLSGIGPKKILDSAGIDTVVDLPGVGQNFQDHPMLSVGVTLQNFTIHPNPLDLFLDRNFSDWARNAWETNRTGPYSIALSNVAAWLGMSVISPDGHEDIAAKLDAQDHAAQLPPDTDPTVIAGYEAQMKALAAAIGSPNAAFYSMSLSGSSAPGNYNILLHPLSRGSVNVNTTDPYDAEPIVDYRALSNPVDADILVEFVKFTRRYHFNTSLAAYGPREMAPGPSVVEDDDIADYVRTAVSPTEYHPSGTCAMLPKGLGGVVDENLRVYGVGRLRVVDASIIPTLPGANTCQTVYAIAEKAADIIKAGQ